MFDTAAAGSASPLFIAGIGLAGMVPGVTGRTAFIRRALPQLAGDAYQAGEDYDGGGLLCPIGPARLALR